MTLSLSLSLSLCSLVHLIRYPELKANEEEARRMKLVLSGSEEITKQMKLVDADSARDLFLLHAR